MPTAPEAEARSCRRCGGALTGADMGAFCPNCLPSLAFALHPDSFTASRRAKPLPGDDGAFGDFQLIEEIARGGMGVVYKARQKSLNRQVAVKMILNSQLARVEDVQRFRAEAEAAANLRHPNIVTVHQVGEHEGQHYFSMDYVEGQSLAELARAEPMSARSAAECIRTVALAVQYAHENGTYHRDLKPSNVLVDRSGQPHITDFGLARRVTHDSDLTLTGQMLGTPAFCSPEQLAAKRNEVGPLSDVYSLGATLYYLLTTRPPFNAASLQEILSLVTHTDPRPIRDDNPAVSRDLETICFKCLQKNPRHRYGSATELADDLDRWLRDEPIVARPVNRGERLWRACRRQPLLAGMTAVICCLAVLLLWLISGLRPAAMDEKGTIPPMPLISGNGASAVLNDKLVVLTSQKGVPGYYRHFHSYDPATRKWDELASPPEIHSSGASGVIDGIFYIVGGVNQDSKPIAQLDGYDSRNGQWRTFAPMPTARAYPGGAVVDHKLYVIGGSALTNNFTVVECYDPLTDSWTACPPMPSARNGLCAVAVNHLIYAIGGNARTAIGTQYIETVEVYDTRTRTWRKGPSVPHACGHGFALVHQNILYVASGWSENRSWKTEAGYPAFESTLFQAWDLADTSSQPWSLLPPLPEPRYQGDGAVVLEGKICVIGGWSTINHDGSPDALPRAEILQFDPSRNIWLKPQRVESQASKKPAAKS